MTNPAANEPNVGTTPANAAVTPPAAPAPAPITPTAPAPAAAPITPTAPTPASPAAADAVDSKSEAPPEKGREAEFEVAESAPSERKRSRNDKDKDKDRDADAKAATLELPELNAAGMPEMSAADAIAKLLNGESVRDVRIANLNAANLTFTKRVGFVNCFLSGTNFQGCTFEDQVDFVGCTFGGAVRLGDTYDGLRMSKSWKPGLGAKFKSSLNFTRCVFNGPLFACGIVCNSHVNFRPCRFKSAVAFPAAIFKQKLWFVQTTCDDTFSFLEAEFSGELADFSSSTFNGEATFARAKFEHRVSFWGSVFKRDATFFRTRFESESSFVKTRCEGVLDFSKAVFALPLELRTAEVAGQINFHLFDGPKLLITRGQVENRLYSERNKHWTAARNDYGHLKNIFEQNNDYRAMDWAYFHFRRLGRHVSGKSWWIKAAEWLILDLGSGYGTKPFNIGILTALAILFFAFIYAAVPGDLFYSQDVPTAQGSIQAASTVPFGFFDAVYVSAASFTTTNFGDWIPRPNSPIRFVMLIEAFVGLFLVALFVAMLTRKIIR